MITYLVRLERGRLHESRTATDMSDHVRRGKTSLRILWERGITTFDYPINIPSDMRNVYRGPSARFARCCKWPAHPVCPCPRFNADAMQIQIEKPPAFQLGLHLQPRLQRFL
jgi:hypothetical protein